MIPKLHPYWHVRSVILENPKIMTLSLSYYIYHPQTISDIRRNWEISAKDFLNESVVYDFIVNTPASYELALNSNFLTSTGEVFHIVMIDMSTGSKAHLDKLRAYLSDHFFQGIVWFNSGRSFHGYGSLLLTHDNWVKFMGLMLLVNLPNAVPTVDPRWIGHRLLAGYSSLRWTKNTHYYKSAPIRLEEGSYNKSAPIEIGSLGTPLKRL